MIDTTGVEYGPIYQWDQLEDVGDPAKARVYECAEDAPCGDGPRARVVASDDHSITVDLDD